MIARIWRGRVRAHDLASYAAYVDATAFAGDDVTLARYYPRDREYLLDFPQRVEQYEVYESS